MAYIAPLFKKPGSAVDSAENYRLVSNLPVLSKTLERVVSQQTESYLGAAGLLPRHQSAYRKGHPRKGLFRSSAFDTVDRDILACLDNKPVSVFGVCGNVLSWMCSICQGAHTLFVLVAPSHRAVVCRPTRFGVGSSPVRAVHC